MPWLAPDLLAGGELPRRLRGRGLGREGGADRTPRALASHLAVEAPPLAVDRLLRKSDGGDGLADRIIDPCDGMLQVLRNGEAQIAAGDAGDLRFHVSRPDRRGDR